MVARFFKVTYTFPKDPFVCPKNPGLARSIAILFGWDWIGTRKILFDREGSLGSLGI